MATRSDLPGKILRNVYRMASNRSIISLERNCRQLYTSSSLFSDVMQIKMPSLSPTMFEGTIVKWYKKEGDSVSAGDILCDIQTDKAVVAFELEEEGILAKILKSESSGIIPINTLIGVMVNEGEDWQNVTVPDTASEPVAASGQAQPQSAAPSGPDISAPSGYSSTYGPAVRAALDMYQLQGDKIKATGPHGRLLKGDVLSYIHEHGLKPVAPKVVAPPQQQSVSAPQPAKPSAPAPAAAAAATPPPPPRPVAAPAPPPSKVEGDQFVDIELTNMRKTIARRLTESKTTIPHAYAGIDCAMDKVLKLRKDLKADGAKVSVNDFIVKAAAVALQRVPQVNATWTGESGQLSSDIDVCVAVATDNGLITPIVRDAISIGVEEISNRVKEMAGRAREGRLLPEEFMGGTFTISNLGMFGISEFSAVINPPQAAIMAVGSSRLTLDAGGAPQTLMNVTLSYDARMLDEHVAARFLEVFKEVMEDPMLMLSQGVPVDLQKLFAK